MSKKILKREAAADKKETDQDRMAKIIDTALQYGAHCSEVKMSLQMSGIDYSTKSIERFIKDRHDMTFGEYRDYMMGIVRLKIKEKITSMALGGNVTLLIFAAKNLCGWLDKPHELDNQKSLNNIEDIVQRLNQHNQGVTNGTSNNKDKEEYETSDRN